jgi:hypothetical protein
VDPHVAVPQTLLRRHGWIWDTQGVLFILSDLDRIEILRSSLSSSRLRMSKNWNHKLQKKCLEKRSPALSNVLFIT